MAKSGDAFRTIGEVSDELAVPKHVLRFWEGKFPQLKPMKRGGGRRFYRPEDVVLLRGIKQLLHTAGYTIKGVQRILREDGVDAVKTLAADGVVSPDGRPQTPIETARPGADTRNKQRIVKERAPASAPIADMSAVLRGHLGDLLAEVESCLALARGAPMPRKSTGRSKRT